MLEESLSLCREISNIIGDRKIVWEMISGESVLMLVPRLVIAECPHCSTQIEFAEAER